MKCPSCKVEIYKLCTKCGKEHDIRWDCEYNLTYQYYLLRLLEKVNKAIESQKR